LGARGTRSSVRTANGCTTGIQGGYATSDGPTGYEREQFGLRVITTDGLREVRRLDLPVSDVAVSPDGEHLLLGSSLQCGQDHPAGGLYVLDAESMRVLVHVEEDVHLRLDGFSSDSRYAYVSSCSGNANGDAVVKAFDLESLAFAGERVLGHFYPNQPVIAAEG
jgi:hypothetical protein